MLNLTNTYRSDNNLAELKEHKSLVRAAQAQADMMCLFNRFMGKDEKDLSNNLLKYDYVGQNIGENTAREQGDDYKEVFRIWKEHDDYNRNLLGDYENVGIGTCTSDDDKRYWVQLFGKKANRNVAEKSARSCDDRIIILLNATDRSVHASTITESVLKIEEKKITDENRELLSTRNVDMPMAVFNDDIKHNEVDERVFKKGNQNNKYEDVVNTINLEQSTTTIYITESITDKSLNKNHANSKNLVSTIKDLSKSLKPSINSTASLKDNMNTLVDNTNPDIAIMISKGFDKFKSEFLQTIMNLSSSSNNSVDISKINKTLSNVFSSALSDISTQSISIDDSNKGLSTKEKKDDDKTKKLNKEVTSTNEKNISDNTNKPDNTLLMDDSNNTKNSPITIEYKHPESTTENKHPDSDKVSTTENKHSDSDKESTAENKHPKYDKESTTENKDLDSDKESTTKNKRPDHDKEPTTEIKLSDFIKESTTEIKHPDSHKIENNTINADDMISNTDNENTNSLQTSIPFSNSLIITSIITLFKSDTEKKSSTKISTKNIETNSKSLENITDKSTEKSKEKRHTQLIIADIEGKIVNYNKSNIPKTIDKHNIKDSKNEQIENTIKDLRKILNSRNINEHNIKIIVSDDHCGEESKAEVGESLHLGD
ncbi:hypothetical protein COBT_000198 [Conglomerata obtusa]